MLGVEGQTRFFVPKSIIPHLRTRPAIFRRSFDIASSNWIPVDVGQACREHFWAANHLSAKRALPKGISVQAGLIEESALFFLRKHWPSNGRDAWLEVAHQVGWGE